MDKKDIKIMIIDDSILARKQLKDVLSTMGFHNFFEANNGEDAVSLYKEIQPDIAFLDIVMPKKDGIAVVKELHDFDKNAYIVMVSSIGTQKQLKSAIEAGAVEFVQKPFNEAQIQAIIHARIEGRD